jgi:hypothetical protein
MLPTSPIHRRPARIHFQAYRRAMLQMLIDTEADSLIFAGRHQRSAEESAERVDTVVREGSSL